MQYERMLTWSDQAIESLRRELLAYLCRLVIRPALAEELTQETFLRGLESINPLPDTSDGRRAWYFRVATNLAIDELRRHGSWRETTLSDVRNAAENDDAIVALSASMAGTPETQAIASEHLVACLACTLRNLPEHRAAALLLKEVHGFSIAEVAGILDSTPIQIKNWLQEARTHMSAHYADSCALIAKRGICYQCVELREFFDSAGPVPQICAIDHVEERLQVAATLRNRPWGTWHRIVFSLIDELDGVLPRPVSGPRPRHE